jgi:dynein heavy chain 1, cytosolic
VIGLALEGAAWSTDKLVLNDGEAVRLNPSQIRWVQSEESSREALVNLPVYLNNDRSDVLFTVDLPFDSAAGALVAMRAVCLTAGG